jgi:type I restriction enzyme S subunit
LASLPVPLPPLAEQKRIVAQVEEVLASVNAARDHLARVPDTLKRFRQSVLAAACSGRLTEDWRASSPEIESGPTLLDRIVASRRLRSQQAGPDKPKSGTIRLDPVQPDGDMFDLPSSWCWAIWDDLADWITYGFTRPMPHVPSGVPIVTARHIVDSKIDLASVDYTTEKAFDALSGKDRPREGELLVTKDGSIGRAAIVTSKEPFCINQSVALLRFGGLSADPQYLLCAIESPWTQHLIDQGAKGSAIRHISITAFGRFPLPLPPLVEQHEIVRRVLALFALADSIEQRVADATARASALTQATLATAFRGELVPTEAALARCTVAPHPRLP